MEAATNTAVAMSSSFAAPTAENAALRLLDFEGQGIRRFLVRNIVEQAALRDVQEGTLSQSCTPRFSILSCAIHSHAIKVQSRTDRRVHEPPKRFRRRVQTS